METINVMQDGTWNTPYDKSNIWKLHQHYGGQYFKGPGTKTFMLDRVFGGAFGQGCEEMARIIVAHVLLELRQKSRPVKLYGFSRGAAIVRRAAFTLASMGEPIEILCCFDTVSSLGVPFKCWPWNIYDGMFMDTAVHSNIKHAIHAMAADEHRAAFQHTLMDNRVGIVQQTFPGDHWEIGSGATTFRWALDMEKLAMES